MKKWWMIAAAFVICAALFFTRAQVPQFASTQVTERTIEQKIETVGTVSYAQTYPIYATTSGQISDVFVKVGDSVTAGQALAQQDLMLEDSSQLADLLRDKDVDGASLRAKQIQMSRILTPVSGTVAVLDLYEGKSMPYGTLLGVVVSTNLHVTAYIPETSRENIAVGDDAQLTRGKHTYAARITSIEPSTEVLGQYKVTLTPSFPTGLEAGMRMDVKIVLSKQKVACVPMQYVDVDGMLLCDTGDGVSQVKVLTGICDALYVELKQGPAIGTVVLLMED